MTDDLEKLKNKSANEIKIIGQLVNPVQLSVRPNGDSIAVFLLTTFDPTYYSLTYEDRTIEHRIILRDPFEIEKVIDLEPKSWIEINGHLSYHRSKKGINAEIIAGSATFREDLMTQYRRKKVGHVNYHPNYVNPLGVSNGLGSDD